jgi:urease accessory protein
MRLLPDDSLTHADARNDARLTLGFSHIGNGGGTRMVERSHFGPLRVQKPLYPEGKDVCHAIIVHPPGGVVGGDELEISVKAGDDAAVFITTPGAAKWYRANGKVSRQQVRIEAGNRAVLEWMPQETIFFDAAEVRLDHDVTLGAEGIYIGCEILCFGRTASGESFSTGSVRQRTSIRRDGRLVWFEQGSLDAQSSAMRSPLGLNGNTVCATLTAVGKTLPASTIAGLREEAGALAGDGELFGATQMKSVIVIRYLGNSSQTARRIMTHAWQLLRPQLTGRDAEVPRIWNT